MKKKRNKNPYMLLTQMMAEVDRHPKNLYAVEQEKRRQFVENSGMPIGKTPEGHPIINTSNGVFIAIKCDEIDSYINSPVYALQTTKEYLANRNNERSIAIGPVEVNYGISNQGDAFVEGADGNEYYSTRTGFMLASEYVDWYNITK